MLLTATPVNTSMNDLVNLVRVLTKNRRNIWAPDIPDYERYLDRVEKHEVDPYPLLDRCVVRRARSDIVNAYRERQVTEPTLEKLELPTWRLGHEDYRYDQHDGGDIFTDLLDDGTAAWSWRPTTWRPTDGPSEMPGPTSVPLRALAGLYMSGLLKRFESSLRAVQISLRRLALVLEVFAAALSVDPPRILDLTGNAALRKWLDYEAVSGR